MLNFCIQLLSITIARIIARLYRLTCLLLPDFMIYITYISRLGEIFIVCMGIDWVLICPDGCLCPIIGIFYCGIVDNSPNKHFQFINNCKVYPQIQGLAGSVRAFQK